MTDALAGTLSIAPPLVEICRLYVLIALAFAAWGKTMGFAAFRRSLAESFPSLPRVDARAGAALASSIVAAEWTIALSMLAGGAAARVGSVAALLLLSLFTATIGAALASGRAIVCSCFGASSHRIGSVDFVRNLALTAAAAVAVAWPTGEGAWPPIQQLTLAGIATILVLASVWLRDLGWLLRAKPEA